MTWFFFSTQLILDAGLAQIVGIVPTLIIVQIGLGRDAHDVDYDTSGSMVRSDARGILTMNDLNYDAPPPGSPPASPILPPLAFSPMQQVQTTTQRTTRLVEVRPRMDEDAECGYS